MTEKSVYSLLPPEQDVYGEWHIAEDPLGQNSLQTHFKLSTSLISKLNTAYFSTSGTSAKKEFTAIVTGNWSKFILSISLRASRDWKYEDGVYVTKQADIQLRVYNGYIILTNYRYSGQLDTVLDLRHQIFFDELSQNNEEFFLALKSEGKALPPFLSTLSITEVFGKFSQPGNEICLGDLNISFESEAKRRLMTPLAKIAFIGFIMDPAMKLPVTEYQGTELFLKDFEVPYKKLLDSFIPLFIAEQNMILVD